MDSKDALVVFEGTKIRRAWHNNQWHFAIVDIIQVLTESGRPRKYWSDLKKKLVEEGFEFSDKIGQLKLYEAKSLHCSPHKCQKWRRWPART